MIVFSIVCLIVVLVPLAYLVIQLLASIRSSTTWAGNSQPYQYFCIAIAAHDEETVIGNTVQKLLKLDYPSDRFSVHIVGDHCTDRTAEFARRAGAMVYERTEGDRNGKASALAWLFHHILAYDY